MNTATAIVESLGNQFYLRKTHLQAFSEQSGGIEGVSFCGFR